MKTRDTRAAFTLIEMLAVILLTSLVLGMALNFYVDLSNRGNRASAATRTWRHSLAVVDRIARDLERTYLLVKPDETDWLSHPWVFLGEPGPSEAGAGRIKFPTRRAPPIGAQEPTQDLFYVAYLLQPSIETDGFELRRWSRAGLPAGLDRDLPNPEDMQVLADEIADFGLRFLDESGEWLEEWDSSQIRYSNKLPTAVEVELAFLGTDETEAPRIERRVNLPMPPVDLEAILEQADAVQDGESSDDDLEGPTVGECILNISELPEELQIVVENSLDEPFAPFLPSIEEYGSDAERYLDPECL